MFRKMMREKQQLSNAECIEILKTEPRGVLSVLGDDMYPYGMPLNYWYNDQDGQIYFHTGKAGHRVDSLKKHDKVSFCVYDQGYRNEGDWALNIKSVIVFGRVKFIEELSEAIDICRNLSLKYTDDIAYIEDEISKYASGVLCFALVPEYITGKIVKES